MNAASATSTRCRGCRAPLARTFADLGSTPLANAYLRPEDLDRPETFYPLHAFVCEECLLVQLPAVASPTEIFSDYAYFSSYSDTWVDHARRYAEEAIERLQLSTGDFVVEAASNDGYLLQFFRERGIRVLGVEPAANVAEAARARAVPTLVRFFGRDAASEVVDSYGRADLFVANNVLAHVPDLDDFLGGVREILHPAGRATFEFPHLQSLVEHLEFDTIYHEHFSYFSLGTVCRLFADRGLVVVDVERLPTHGGSLRVTAKHEDGEEVRPTAAVGAVLEAERRAGLDRLDAYDTFAERVREAKRDLLSFLLDAKRAGASIVAYGAAAKGATLLNYCGIRGDFLDYVVDRSPHKQGRFMPGVRVPIASPERVSATRPDFLLLLAWNLADEIATQMAHVRDWGCRFITPLPTPRVLD